MLSYLIANNELEAALKLGSMKSHFDQELINAFDRGDHRRFLEIFSLLSKNSKLEFYIRVYFLIYSIHPSLKGLSSMPKQDIQGFKEYLDSRGAELAKTNQFLEFYALPFIKNPLKHEAFKNLFKKEWVNNLREKVLVYCREESHRIKQQANAFQSLNSKYRSSSKADNESSRELLVQLTQYIDKYKVLEEQYKAAVELSSNTLMETQNKWFHITKDLVNCSKSLIQLASQNSRVTSERKFLNIKKKIDKYDKFVNKRIEDMITQSQDISIFDRPSINQLSCTLTQYTQKNVTSFAVDDYIPTDYLRLKQDLISPLNTERCNSIIKGLIWRVLKSKDVKVRRLNIIGILMHDTIGLRTGSFRDLFTSATRTNVLQLMYYIEHDYYGRCALFSTGLVKDLIQLLKKHYKDEMVVEYGIPMLQILSVREDMKLEMIEMDIIRFFLKLLKDHLDRLSEHVIENIVATLLNLCSRPEGIQKFQQEPEAFNVLGGLLESEYPIIRIITNATIYTLLGNKVMHNLALSIGLNEVVSYIIEHDSRANIKELRYLEERLIKFQPTKVQAKPPSDSDDVDEIEDDSVMDCDEQLVNLDEYIKGHEFICSEYVLPYRDAQQQMEETREIYDLTILRIREKRQSNKSRSPLKFDQKSKSPVMSTNTNKQNKAETLKPDHKKPFQKNNPVKQQMQQAQFMRNEADTAYFVASSDNAHLAEQRSSQPMQQRPRGEILRKLNQQIRASKFKRASEQVDENKNKFSFNKREKLSAQDISSSDIIHRPEKTQHKEYQEVFSSKPKIPRSPSTTPEKLKHI